MSIQDVDRRKLGEILVGRGLLSDEKLAEALEIQREKGGRVGQILTEMHAVTEEEIARTMAEQKGFELIDLNTYDVDLTAVNLVDAHFAESHLILPIGTKDGDLVAAMSDPLDIQAVDSLQCRVGRHVHPVVATESSVRRAIKRYLTEAAFDDIVQSAADVFSTSASDRIETSIEEVPVVKLVNKILTEAVQQGASDVHIEPMANDVAVRFRVDGVLHPVMRIPKTVQAALISRIKIMAELNISERRIPQDGRFMFAIGTNQTDVRVTILPTTEGESVTLRLLSRDFSLIRLEDLGLRDEVLAHVIDALKKPFGAILVCGPTGSGKTTTMYAGIHRLNGSERKIVTIEDPVEYQIPGVTQVPVNAATGMTFASGLRSILRSDPDVVMVGEMRDPETAQIGIRGAMTGHLVLSSLHTNDAPGALSRLVDIGVPPFLIPAAVVAVIAQRLVRKLCEHCKEPYEGDPALMAEAGRPMAPGEKPTFYRAVGCNQCFGTGYRGRVGLFEFLEMTPEVGNLVMQGVSVDDIRGLAKAKGMQTMRQDGLWKVAEGETSLEEVIWVVG